MTAPVVVTDDDLPFDTSASTFSAGDDASSTGADFRSWWPYNVSKADHYTLDPALAAVRASIAADGPFAGVIGFSQGAGLAGILCTCITDIAPPESGQEPFKFAVFYSGFRVQPAALQHYYDDNGPITTPSLHVLGSLDTVVSEERSMRLYDACGDESRQLLRHPGGHFVPNSKGMVQAVADFIEGACKEPAPVPAESGNSKAKEEKDEWDEFDKIGQA